MLQEMFVAFCLAKRFAQRQVTSSDLFKKSVKVAFFNINLTQALLNSCPTIYRMHFYHSLVQNAMPPREISIANYVGCCVKKKEHLKLDEVHLMHNPLASSSDGERLWRTT